jgi:pimeloyl-ACP methyl ester carboxylesterase
MRLLLILCLGAAGVLVLAPLLLWFATRQLVARAERAYPPEGQFETVQGVPLHYVSRGSGPAVVLIHGAFGALQDFTATIAPALQRGHRVIAVDRPGHGYSGRPPGRGLTPARQAELLHGLLQRLQPGPATLVGFSLGGAVALAYALAHPEAVRALVILNGGSFPWPTPEDRIYSLPGIPLLGPLLVRTVVMPLGTVQAAANVREAFAPEPVPEAYGRSPLALALRPASFEANADDVLALKAALREQSRRYGELRMPLAIVAGAGDQIVSPLIHAQALHAAVPGSAFTLLPRAGHQILYTRPADVLAAIARAEGQAAR